MENLYLELKNKQLTLVNAFKGIFFAFSDKQFKEGMEALGLTEDDTQMIYSLGQGGYILRTKSKEWHQMFEDFDKEVKEAMNDEKTGETYIYQMFDYELGNHEFCLTHDVEDTLDALGLTDDEVSENPRLSAGLEKAIQNQLEEETEDGGDE